MQLTSTGTRVRQGRIERLWLGRPIRLKLKARNGGGRVLGEGQSAPLHQLGLGSAVSSLVQGSAVDFGAV